jgi:hypothetical protein
MDATMKCPACKRKKLKRIIELPNIDAGPQSLGRAAEQNYNKLSKDEKAKFHKKKDRGPLGDVYTKIKKKLGYNPTKERMTKYIKTGE